MWKNRTPRGLAICALALLTLSAMAAPDFTLREELSRQWTDEYVTFPLTAAQLELAQAQRPLLDPDGKPVTYQIIPGAPGASRLAFQTSLAPLATREFSFAATGEASFPTDLKVEEADGMVRLYNGKTGIALSRAPAAGTGPLAGIMLNSGKWVAGSRLVSEAPVTQVQIQITARGPVMAEATCKLTFGDQGTWETRYRLFAGEPVVLIDEVCAVDTQATFSLVLSDNFAAEQLLFRYADSIATGSYGKNAVLPVTKGQLYLFEPWLRWHASNQRGNCFSVFNAREPDLLTVSACQAGVWVDPALPREQQAVAPLVVSQDDTGLHIDFPLKHGRRQWMLTALDRDASLTFLQDPELEYVSGLPYRYLIKYGHFPLDMIKDYVTRWPSQLEHPRLLLTKKDVETFKGRVADPEPYQKTAEYFLNNPTALTAFRMDDAIPAYLATEDPRLGDLLAQKALDMLQHIADYLIDQNGLPFGAAPHNHSGLSAAVGLADIIYDSPQTTPEMRDRLRALAAFLGYTTSRPEYWSPARGYAANPNMTTSVYGYQASLAAFIPDHPYAQQWVQEGMDGLKDQLDTWSDDNGGWLEAPHYAMVSYDQILAILLMAHNAGFNDWLYTDPKVKKVIQWFAKIDTPPDSRLGGFRHRPPLGNTYMNEPCGEYGLLAYLFREQDPQFSAEMQWQFNQNKQYGTAGIGGFFPAFAGYRKLLTDPDLPQQAPQYGSELFPETGLVLRDSYPSDRETYLHMIHGTNHAHYDDDSGSIVLYGKGRILADEYGYYGYVPQEDHSMVESPQAGRGLMKVRDFVTGPRFDYVAGVKEAWTRHIAFVKGADPEAPTYFLLNDAFRVNGPATWRLWLTAQEVQLGPQSALVVGKEDVDMDVFFLTPQGVALTTEPKTRTSGSGMFPDWHWGPMETTQIGLIAAEPHVGGFNVVLYPRLKTTKPATFVPLADGQGVKVTHEAGVDYVFLSGEPFIYAEGDIHFEGMAGMIQLRGDEVILSMGSGGKVSARGQTVTSDKPLPVVSTNLFPNGDFETGKLDPFPATDNEQLKVSMFRGNPVADDTAPPGKHCLALTVKQHGSAHIAAPYRVPVDSQQVYRIRVRVYADSKLTVTLGGYAPDGKGNHLQANNKTWQWALAVYGPTEGWQTYETTCGPPGSGAAVTWPPGISSTFLQCFIRGGPGTLYLDDITFEPVD